MSRPLRRTAIACRAPVAGAAAVVLLLSACGGGGYGSRSAASDTGARTSTAPSTTASGDPEFCAQAAGIDKRVEAAVSDAQGDDPSVVDAFRQIAEELRAMDPPPSIRSDWATMAGGLDQMADAFADLDITDSKSLAALESAEKELSTASENVENYLRDECGIAP
jgi:hypothetical protein